MKIKLFAFAGVTVSVSVYVPLLAALFLLDFLNTSAPLPTRIVGLSMMTVAVFVCILIHEIGHVIVSLMCGLKPTQIVITPLGGEAHVEQSDYYWHDVAIFAGGPIATALICVAAFVMSGANIAIFDLSVKEGPAMRLLMDPTLSNLMVWVCFINFYLLISNLVPTLPTDGGRIVFAIAEWLNPDKDVYVGMLKWSKFFGMGLTLIGCVMMYFRLPYASLVEFSGVPGMMWAATILRDIRKGKYNADGSDIAPSLL